MSKFDQLTSALDATLAQVDEFPWQVMAKLGSKEESEPVLDKLAEITLRSLYLLQRSCQKFNQTPSHPDDQDDLDKQAIFKNLLMENPANLVNHQLWREIIKINLIVKQSLSSISSSEESVDSEQNLQTLRVNFRKMYMAQLTDALTDDLLHIHQEENISEEQAKLLAQALETGVELVSTEKDIKEMKLYL